jgi:hypothetical protein
MSKLGGWLRWLRGCLNVVTGFGEFDCCVTGCPCKWCCCHPLFHCSSVQGLWVLCNYVSEMGTCHLPQGDHGMCYQSDFEQ